MRRINNIFKITTLATLIIGMCACSDDDDFVISENSSTEDIAGTLNQVSTKWGLSKREVENSMKGYQTIENTDPDVLQFQAKKSPITVIYQFVDNKLCAAVIKAKTADESLDIDEKIRDFTYIGELNEKNIYTNTDKNIFAASYTITEDDERFHVIGFTPHLPVTEKVNNHECVDLGLSVRWANCNIGAEKPEDSGGYYAWGEIAEKDQYLFSNYQYYDDDNKSYTYLGDSICGTQYDVATSLWGNQWQIPTKLQMEELRRQCDWVSAVVNGVNGYKVFGKNGNYIFLPAAGKKAPTIRDYNSRGYYMTATLVPSNIKNYTYLFFKVSSIEISKYGLERCQSSTVRAVVK